MAVAAPQASTRSAVRETAEELLPITPELGREAAEYLGSVIPEMGEIEDDEQIAREKGRLDRA